MAEQRDMQWPFSVASVVGAWKLDETSGTSAGDWSGSGYNFTYDATAPAQFQTPTQSNTQLQWHWGYALNFDGTDDGTVRSGAASNLQLQTFTIEALIYIPTSYVASTTCIISYFPKGANSDGRGWFFGASSTGKVQLSLGDASGAFISLNSVTSIPLDTWKYVACTFDGSYRDIWISGVSDVSNTQALTISYADNPGFPGDVHTQNIGRAHTTAAVPTFFWKGYIADVRVSSVVRTQAEMIAMQEHLFPTASESGLGDPPRGLGLVGLPFSPYMRYKNVRRAVGIYNNLMLAP